METLLQDVRYAARSLRRSAGFTIAAVVTLALGIGANTAIFTVIDAVLLRPLPYPAADRLAVMWGAGANGQKLLVAIPDVNEWRARNHTFEDIGTIRQQSVNLTGGETPDRLPGAFVSSNTLALLGARIARGRLFTPEESAQGASGGVAVLSYASWKTRFGGDPGVVGRTLTLNGRPHVVIGVLTADFVDPYGGSEVWLPMSAAPAGWFTRGAFNVWTIGRIKPGTTFAQARRDLSAVAAQLAAEYPTTSSSASTIVTPMREEIVGKTGPTLLIVLGFVAVVLLIACANVANLQLARATARRREFSVRAALGAGRWRLARQLLTENLLIAMLGGLLGCGFAVWATQAFVATVPGGLPPFGAVAMNLRVLEFCGAIAIGVGLVFGAAPALHAARADLSRTLNARSGGERVPGRLDPRDLFVAAQLALCVILLVGAGLLGRSLVSMEHARPGFDTEHLLTAQLRLPPAKYQTPDKISQFMSSVLAEVRAVPGVQSAALVSSMPQTGNFGLTTYQVEGTPLTQGPDAPMTQQNVVSDGFFRTMAIPLTAGRDFNAFDRAGSEQVAIINDEFARREWPGQSPLGKRVKLIGPPDILVTVVGVVGSVKQQTLGDAPAPQLYQPVAQASGTFTSFAVRTAGDAAALASALRAAVWRVDPDQPVWGIRPMESYVNQHVAQPRFTLVVTAVFALLALVLALVGVYGVMSYILVQRTREIGIRMALGARREQVVAMVLGRGARTVAAATVMGLAGAYAAANLLRTQLFEVKANDPLTFAIVPAVLAAAALAACYIPARRAARVDPVIALRQE